MDNDKRKIDLIRDAAGSFEVKKRGETNPEPLTGMFSAKGMLLALKANSIFKIQMADDIDPERNHIEAKGSTLELYPIGTHNPIVSRTFPQAKRLLEFAPLDKKAIEGLLDIYFDVFHEMAQAYLTLTRLEKDYKAALDEFRAVSQEEHSGSYISDIPQVDSLEIRSKSFFASVHKALKGLMAYIQKLFPELKPQFFDKMADELEQLHSANLLLVKVLKNYTGWYKIVWDTRNAIEHPREGFYARVTNMQLAPNLKIDPPCIAYEINGEKVEKADLIGSMAQCLDELLGFSEEILVSSVVAKVAVNPGLQIYRKRDEEMDPNCPFPYDVTFKPNIIEE